MTRVNFDMADSLIKRIDEIGVRRGFESRAGLFRHLAMEFLERYDNKVHALPPMQSLEQMANDCALSSKEKQIAEAKKKLHEIVDEHGMEYGIPPEAVAQIEKIAKLMQET
jgi:metal-responsive CopG/Arc/MetJ family transcriptional regulator